MQILEILKEKANRAYVLSQRASSEKRKRRLRELYRHFYETYRRQRILIEDIDRGLEQNRAGLS